jgi:hypothetical protein
MINKISNQAFETRYKGIRSELVTPLGVALIHKKINLLKKGSLFPDELINEMEEYAQRNEILDSNIYIQDNSIHKCCPNCLKAHTLAKARELGVQEATINNLARFLKGETGHNGYYLDQDELIKIEN